MKQHGQSNYVATHDSLVCPVDANKFEESSTSQGKTNINYWSSPPAQLTQFTCPKSQSRFWSVLLTSLARPTSLSPSPKYPDEDQNLAISLSLPAMNFVEQDLEGPTPSPTQSSTTNRISKSRMASNSPPRKEGVAATLPAVEATLDSPSTLQSAIEIVNEDLSILLGAEATGEHKPDTFTCFRKLPLE